MLRVLGIVAGAAVGSVIYDIIRRHQPNLENEINKQVKCAVCNRPLAENKVILRCKRHAVHEGCHETLLAQGQEKCPFCLGRF